MVYRYYPKTPRIVIKPSKNNFVGDFISLPDRTMKIKVKVIRR